MSHQVTFLDLPGEMRNAIYTAYIEDYKPETIELIGGRVRAPPLTRVCRQVRDEFHSLWANRETDTSQVTKVKAAVFDFYVDYVERFLTTHRNNLPHSLQIRFVMTRVWLSLGNPEYAFSRLLSWRRRWEPPLSQSEEDHRLHWMMSVPTTYVAGFYSKSLSFEGTQFATKLFSTVDRRLEPMRVAVRDAIRKQNGQTPPTA